MNHFDEIVARIEAAWPDYQVWYVPRAVGGMTWCARRHDDHRRVLNAESAAELGDLLRQEEEA